MPTDVTMWMGPLFNGQVPACFAPGSTFVPAFTCRNPYLAPVPTCQQMIASFDRNGRFLPSMLKSRGVDPNQLGKLYVGTFSAGNGALKDRILLSDADRQMITGIYAADSTYSDWIDGNPKKGPIPKPGYMAFLRDVLRDKKFFVATAGVSRPTDREGRPLPSSAESMLALGDALERETGRKFEPFDASWSNPRPISAKRMVTPAGGLIVFMDYGANIPHVKHPTVIAPQVWQHVVLPWLGSSDCIKAVAMQGLGDASKCTLYEVESFPDELVADPSTPGFIDEPGEPSGAWRWVLAGAAGAVAAYCLFRKPRNTRALRNRSRR